MSPSVLLEERRVLIIGGGLAGLVLAQGLARNNVPFAVFEKDPTKQFRPQGYRAKVPGPVATALKEQILTPELYADFEDTCSFTSATETSYNVVNGQVWGRRGAGPPRPGFGKMFTIDRARFRELLMENLDEHIYFGKQFDRYEVKDDNRVIAYFSDGTSEEGSMLVGADGKNSNVRQNLLPNHPFADTGCSTIYGKTFFTQELYDRAPKTLFDGISCGCDYSPFLSEVIYGDMPVAFLTEPIRFPAKSHRNDLPQDYLYWGVSFRNRLFSADDKDLETMFRGNLKDLTLKISAEWDPAVRSILELQDADSTISTRIISTDPNMEAWTSSPCVTLVGDAVHLMSSAGGVGAVTAIKNAIDLANTLSSPDGFSQEKVGEYEAGMRQFSGLNIQRSFAGGKKMFNQLTYDEGNKIKW